MLKERLAWKHFFGDKKDVLEKMKRRKDPNLQDFKACGFNLESF